MTDGRKTNGGARKNAGRKPKQEKYATAIEQAETRCADRLPTTLDTLEKIADGEAEQVEEEWVAKVTLTIGRGANIRQLYPNAKPDEMVLVRKKIVTFAPDVRANIYLADRVMGKPADGDETKIADRVETELDAIIETIKSTLGADSAQKVLLALAAHDADAG